MPVRWIVLLSVIALLCGGAFYGGYRIEALRFDKFKSEQTAVAEKARANSEAHARQLEQDNASKIAALDADYQEKLHDQQQNYEAALRGAGDGSLRLYVHTHSCTANMPKAGAGADRSDDSGTAQLSGDTAKFLVSESHRADNLAVQVNALQAVVQRDRELCNGVVP